MVYFVVDKVVLKTLHSIATASMFGLRDLTFRFEDKRLLCRLRSPDGGAAVVFKSADSLDTDIEGTDMYTMDVEDVQSVIKASKDTDKVRISMIDGQATVSIGNVKKRFPLTTKHIWMERVPNPPITQIFTMTSDQLQQIVSAFEAKEKWEATKVSFDTEEVIFTNFDNQRTTEARFKKEDFGRASLTKSGKVGYYSVSLMKMMSLIPKDADTEVAVDVDMPIAMSFSVETGWYKMLLAPFIEEK